MAKEYCLYYVEGFDPDWNRYIIDWSLENAAYNYKRIVMHDPKKIEYLGMVNVLMDMRKGDL